MCCCSIAIILLSKKKIKQRQARNLSGNYSELYLKHDFFYVTGR